jgi:hypothetical protein
MACMAVGSACGVSSRGDGSSTSTRAGRPPSACPGAPRRRAHRTVVSTPLCLSVLCPLTCSRDLTRGA